MKMHFLWNLELRGNLELRAWSLEEDVQVPNSKFQVPNSKFQIPISAISSCDVYKSIGQMEYLDKAYLGMSAFCLTRQDDRNFRIDRILEIKVVKDDY